MGSVAEGGTTVLLSSHLLSDLERVCDYLIVLRSAKVNLVGSVDDLVSRHRTLVGPRRRRANIAGVADIIQESHTDKQSTLLVRTDGPILDPAWTVRDVTMEDLVLGYLACQDPSRPVLKVAK
jgi:ABC-2 type transport system ATP-binding protein